MAALRYVVFNQAGIVHFVHMIARKNQNEFGFVLAQDVNVLKHGVRRSTVPGRFVHPLLRGQQINKLIDFIAQKRPAMLQMAQQAMGLVLGQHANTVHTRIYAV